MAKTGRTGFNRIIFATRYSIQGLRFAWVYESAFRQEIVLSLLCLPAAVWLGQSAVERTLLFGCCLLVLIVELLNSAIEAAIDRHGDEHHELSGRAKDMGSAAVFLALFLTVSVWAAVAMERFVTG